MKLIRIPVAMTLLLFVAACVTINVYFPAEAAEKAADRIIQDVYGEQPGAAVEPQSRLPVNESLSAGNVLLDWFISPAHAKADLSVNTPAIQQLQASVVFGSLIRAVHHWSANLLVVTTFLHLVRVFLTGGYKNATNSWHRIINPAPSV